MTGEFDENGNPVKTHVNNSDNDSTGRHVNDSSDAQNTSTVADRPDGSDKEGGVRMRRLQLCKRCVDILNRGRYYMKRVDVCQLTHVRSCELCHARTRCGLYDVSVEKWEPREHRRKK